MQHYSLSRIIRVTGALALLAAGGAGAEVLSTEFGKSIEIVDENGVRTLTGPRFTAVVQPRIIHKDLRDLPVLEPWQPGDPIVTIPKRRGPPAIADPQPVNPVDGPDPLLQRQQDHGKARGAGGFTTPIFNFQGDDSGSNPHDPNGEIGPDFYVQAINGPGGTRYTWYDKTDGSIAAGPFTLSDLAETGPCTGGLGDPIMLFDEMANRWVLTEFSSTDDRMCVYVAQDDTPLDGPWAMYDFQSAFSFPDYPKYGVWSDAYYVGTNETSSTQYAFERDQMLQGNNAQMVSFPETDPSAFGFFMMPPVDHDGATPPPAGEPGIFIRHFDDEAHEPGNNDPSNDLLQLYEFNVDWTTTAISQLTGPFDLQIAEIDSELCGFTSFFCFPQPNSGTTLDPLREVIMNLPKYRNFGSHETIVGNLVTDVDDTDHGGVRWFELRRTGGGNWTLEQEGTYAPDRADGEDATEHRWMAGSAMDESGNIAIGFNLSNDTNIFPSMTYSGREATDAPGVLTQGETDLVLGDAPNGSNRWGDYSSMSVDPVAGCTFWFTSNYSSASTPTGATQIAAFKFDACGEPTFTLSGDNTDQLACTETGDDMLDDVAIDVGSRNGFTNPVSLAFNPPLPAGFTGDIDPTLVNPPGTAIASLTVTDGTAPGDFTATVEGTATGTDPRTLDIAVNVADTTPPAPALQSPADGALNVDPRPTFSWSDATQANSYTIQVATDPDFNDIVINATAMGTSFMPAGNLPTSTQLYWRVSAANQCGTSAQSATFTFTTQAAGGDCGPGTEAVIHFEDDMESGDNGWTHNAAQGEDTWELNDTDANSPTMSWRGLDIDTISDQRLVSPQITLPADVDTPTLQFYNKRDIEAGGAGCFDAGILEYSTDGGSTWTQVLNDRLDTDPYTGTIDSGFGNPLGGQPGWCGMQDWTRTVVDLRGLEGENLNFRYRIGTDSSIAADDWHIDDAKVQSCEVVLPEVFFVDGFEEPPAI